MFKNLANEFKKFAMRGNVIDMAVGIIIGAAFGKIVDSLVKDVIMPPIGLLLGKVDFSNLFLVLKDGATPAPYNSLAAAQAAGAVTMNLGLFVNAIISFLIVAFAVFILIKAINELQAKMDKKEAQNIVKTTPHPCRRWNTPARRGLTNIKPLSQCLASGMCWWTRILK